jgi:hypothetical protein
MGKSEKLLLKILRGTSDSNIPFEQLCQLLMNMGALLHKYLKLLRGKDRQLNTLIYQTLYNKAFRRKAESLCNNAEYGI